jgi:hypothetical protein
VAYHSIPWIELEREMFEVLKTEKFATLFSFIIGFGLIAILIPVCKGDQCFVKKAPSVEEMKKTTFQLGKKCYQFTSEMVECPAKGAIEAFVAYSPA